MNDNFYIDDLIESLKRDVVMERYYPLIDYKAELSAILNKFGIVRKNQITETAIEDIAATLGNDISRLFARFIHIYDFNKTKLRDIKDYVDTKEYDNLADLLRLSGVRLLRANLYLNSGVTLEVLAEKSTEDIRNMVSNHIKHNNLTEIVPQPKEVNCHREVAKMILHTKNDN